jgi:hypothetical protein
MAKPSQEIGVSDDVSDMLVLTANQLEVVALGCGEIVAST